MRLRLTIEASPFLNGRAWRTWQTALASTFLAGLVSDAVTEAVRAVLPDDFPDFSVRVDPEEPRIRWAENVDAPGARGDEPIPADVKYTLPTDR